jgi:apolipoprotein N-acyltransferase
MEVRMKRLFALSLLSSFLLWLSFFPMNLGFLAWFAMVPWILALRIETATWKRILAVYIGSLAFSVAALQWMRVAHAMMLYTWLALSIYTAFYFTLAHFLARALLKRRWPLVLVIPCVWTGLDYCRAHFPTGFSFMEPLGTYHPIGFGWYFLGYTQHENLLLRQIADLTGVYGITWLIWFANATIVTGWDWQQKLVTRRSFVIPLTTAFVLLLISHAYGLLRTFGIEFEDGPNVALVQGNLEQDLKMEGGLQVANHFSDLSDQAYRQNPKPDLIVWPETSFPWYWLDADDGIPGTKLPNGWIIERDLIVEQVLKRWNTGVLLGLNALIDEGDEKAWKYNSAVLIHPQISKVSRYDKMHLVPFGEYVPLVEFFPWLKIFTPYQNDYSCKRGEKRTVFQLPNAKRPYYFGMLICYEDSDPTLGRKYGIHHSDRPDVDFLVNISNDGWFKGTEEHEQHMAIARFRAIEARKPLVRSVNMGISGIVDGNGTVVQLPGKDWASSKRVTGIVSGPIPLDHRTSIYAYIGDWVPVCCWISWIIMFFRRKSALR